MGVQTTPNKDFGQWTQCWQGEACCRLTSTRSSMDVADYYSHYSLTATIEARLLCSRREDMVRRLELRLSLLRATHASVTVHPLSPKQYSPPVRRSDSGTSHAGKTCASPSQCKPFFTAPRPLTVGLRLPISREAEISPTIWTHSSTLQAKRQLTEEVNGDAREVMKWPK